MSDIVAELGVMRRALDILADAHDEPFACPRCGERGNLHFSTRAAKMRAASDLMAAAAAEIEAGRRAAQGD